jgi:hypothetical protein
MDDDNTDNAGGGGGINDASMGGLDIGQAEADLGEYGASNGFADPAGTVDLQTITGALAMMSGGVIMATGNPVVGALAFMGGSINLGNSITDISVSSVAASLSSDPDVAAAQIAGFSAYEATMNGNPYGGQNIAEAYSIANNVQAVGCNMTTFWQTFVQCECGYFNFQQ